MPWWFYNWFHRYTKMVRVQVTLHDESHRKKKTVTYLVVRGGRHC